AHSGIYTISLHGALPISTSLPAGATASFSQNPVSFGSGTTSTNVTLTITTTGSTPPGTTPFTVQATNTISASDLATATSALAVICTPAITTQPISQGAAVGQTVTFSVSAL